MRGASPDVAAGRALAFVVATAAMVLAASPAHGGRTADACADAARRLEDAEGIPRGLVQAVALAESGRWLDDLRLTRPWPWTVTAGPDSFFFPSKEAALLKVRELTAQGRTNIDVGCMQINLGWHGDAFASLEEALDPATNVAYGARFLKDLRLRTRSWARATARYHSSSPDRGEAYRAKVYRLWQEVRRRRIEDRRDARVATSAAVVRGGASASGERVVGPGFELPTRAGGIAVVRGQ